MSSSIQDLKKIGEDLGYTGIELQAFVKEQQENERTERAAIRQLEKDKIATTEARLKADSEKLQLQFQIEQDKLAAAEATSKAETERQQLTFKLEQDKLAAAIAKQQSDMDRAQLAFKAEQERERENEERKRNFEMERMKFEAAVQTEKHRVEAARAEKDRELEREKLDLERRKLERSKTNGDGNDPTDGILSTRKGFSRGPKMTPWNERDDMDAYLNRFENSATMENWSTDRWAGYLANVLSGKALDVIDKLTQEDARDYDKVKTALLRRFNNTEEGYRQKLYTSRAEPGESPEQFVVRLLHYLKRWVDLAMIEQSFEGLSQLIVREQFLQGCSKDLEVYLREGSEKNLTEMTKRAENYMQAHGIRSIGGSRYNRFDFKKEDKKEDRDKQKFTSNNESKETRRCHHCGIVGHVRMNCKKLQKERTGAAKLDEWEEFDEEDVGAMESQDWRLKKNNDNSYRGNSNWRGGNQNHYGFNRGQEQGFRGGYKPWQKETPSGEKSSEPEITCKQHKKERCTECLNITPTLGHPCNALLAEYVELKCGCQIPVVADACKVARKGNMPVCEGRVNGKEVTVLRDSGCSTIVVKRDLVEDTQLTGEETRCVLIDGTIRKTPLARIQIDTPYYTGEVEAVCMKNPLYELIIGNMAGIKEGNMIAMLSTDNLEETTEEMNETTNEYVIPSNGSETEVKTIIEETQAVTTRQMTQNANKVLKPLRVTTEIDGNISREELIKLQQQDRTLITSIQSVDSQKKEDELQKGEAMFKMKTNILYRIVKNREGRVCSQVVIPKELREEALRIAHEGVMSGHQGINKTSDRLLQNFWFPGITAEIVRFCKSCDICQRTVAKGRISKVPLGQMPIIDTPFDRIAIDLIGPIEPISERGHRYILTVIDYATRYPEAVALKTITTETVAEALVEIYSRVGIPREVLSDQGTQFVSGIMKEVSRILSVKQLVTTPYHPMCNGLCEKFNGTLKNMLKKVCAEKPKDWDRYIAAILFAYRGVKQESLGFTPFEMLYGRTVRGPMNILRELWTKEELEPEVKTTYEYVIDLQNRLRETCELAQIELKKAQAKQGRYYNLKSVKREFEPGNKVLILRPNNNNKLLMQWQGPFVVLERVHGNDYLIDLKGQSRMYHANMLKQYFERKPTTEETMTNAEEVESESDFETVGAAILEVEDTEEIKLPVMEKGQTENYKNIDVNPELDENKKRDIWKLLGEYSDIFTDMPNLTTLGEHEIQLTSIEPIRSKPHPTPYAARNLLSTELDSMLSLNVIEPSTAHYASPVVMVKKSDGSVRTCCDYRKLNKITLFDPEPMQSADEIFAMLNGCQYFSKFDLAKGYWQVPMREQDKPYTTITTHRGLFQFKVMPFGLINAPATFSRVMRKLLDKAECLFNYLDDVLAPTNTWELHLTVLRDLFERVRKGNLTIRPSKCSVGYRSLKFLGHQISAEGLSPAKDTVDKMLRAPRPETKTQLRSFIGLVGYYRRFIPNYAHIAVSLTDLTCKGSPNILCWGNAQEEAFNSLRQHVAKAPVLRLPDYSKQFILQTDASNRGLGAILLQEEEGLRHPIAYASRKLLSREQNHATIERECLAIVWAMQKFQNFLYGQHFLLEVDHEPLKYLTQSSYQNGRLMRWALALQAYRFTVNYIKGSMNVGADFLSRHSIDM